MDKSGDILSIRLNFTDPPKIKPFQTFLVKETESNKETFKVLNIN